MPSHEETQRFIAEAKERLRESARRWRRRLKQGRMLQEPTGKGQPVGTFKQHLNVWTIDGRELQIIHTHVESWDSVGGKLILQDSVDVYSDRSGDSFKRVDEALVIKHSGHTAYFLSHPSNRPTHTSAPWRQGEPVAGLYYWFWRVGMESPEWVTPSPEARNVVPGVATPPITYQALVLSGQNSGHRFDVAQGWWSQWLTPIDWKANHTWPTLPTAGQLSQ